MLTATIESSYLNGYGGLSGSAQVEELQRALKELSQAASWPAVDPKGIDGIVGPNTRSAVIAAVNGVPQVPGRVKAAFIAIGIAGALSAKAAAEIDGLITQFANELTIAAKAYTAARAGSTQPGTGTTTSATTAAAVQAAAARALLTSKKSGTFWQPPAGTPWYKQGRVYAVGGGVLALGIGSFFLFRR